YNFTKRNLSTIEVPKDLNLTIDKFSLDEDYIIGSPSPLYSQNLIRSFYPETNPIAIFFLFSTFNPRLEKAFSDSNYSNSDDILNVIKKSDTILVFFKKAIDSTTRIYAKVL